MRKPMPAPILLALLAVFLAGALLLCLTKDRAEKPHAPIMRDAAARADAAFRVLKEERLRRGLPINAADDPNETGIIGDGYTEITTTLGSLEAKRSAANPNLSAAIADMFVSVGLRPGDRIAVNLSGSFPGVNIAVLCAMDALGLEGAAIPSVGASTYGANIPAFTYPDMEAYLSSVGLVTRRSFAFSIGGSNDTGAEMPAVTREAIRLRLIGLGYESIEIATLDENIGDRYNRFVSGGSVKCFVNVGGNDLSFGASGDMLNMPGGVMRQLPDGMTGGGLVQRFLREGVPVIHLLNMKNLFAALNLPFDPIPMQETGQGDIYFTEGYPRPIAIAVCLAYAVALGMAIWYWRRRRGGRVDSP